jgi:hypothetical protein
MGMLTNGRLRSVNDESLTFVYDYKVTSTQEVLGGQKKMQSKRFEKWIQQSCFFIYSQM